MDWLFLVFSLFGTGYCLNAWKEYSNNESLWLALLYAFVVFLLVSKLFLINHFSGNIKTVISILVYCSWAVMLVALFFVLKKRK
jgi:hypothetical protein